MVQTPQSYNTRTRLFALSHTEDQTYGFICFLFPAATCNSQEIEMPSKAKLRGIKVTRPLSRQRRWMAWVLKFTAGMESEHQPTTQSCIHPSGHVPGRIWPFH